MQIRPTFNFLIPAQGATAVLSTTLPADGNYTQATPGPAAGQFYGIDFRSVAQITEGQLFIPQACTIDASSLTAGTFLTFSIPAIEMNWIIPAGQTRTFQFPALPDLIVLITPSGGAPSFNVAWYNYPSLPEELGNAVSSISGSVTVTSLPAVTIGVPAEGTGTDGGGNPPSLLANHRTSFGAKSRAGITVQNQSASPMQVVLSTSNPAANATIILLAPSSLGAGNPGDSIILDGLHSGQVDIYTTGATDQFAAREHV